MSEPTEEQVAGTEGSAAPPAVEETAPTQELDAPEVLPPEVPPPETPPLEAGPPTRPPGPTVPMASPTTPLPGRVTPAHDAPTLSNLPGASPAPGLPIPAWGTLHILGPTPAASSRAPALARRFPAWLSAFLAVGAFAAVGLAYSAAELIGRADWADGASLAGGVALALASAVLVGAATRYIAGRRVVSMLALGTLLALSLGATGLAGVAASPQLHAAQAQALERDHQSQAAIAEYARAGEHAPNAPDIARVLVNVGEQRLQAGDYAGALAQFTAVTTSYGESGDVVVRARDGIFETYSAWVQSTRDDVPYPDAIAFFSQYRSGSAIEAQAHYQYGAALAAAKRYNDAIQQFETVTASFATSSYAPQAHTAAASAYLALGKFELAQECASALPTYQKLATAYADTPEGKQAKSALAAPQTVTGHIYSAPGNPAPTVFLSKHINPNTPFASGEYHTPLNTKSGLFTFRKVAQGTYYLTTLRDAGGRVVFVWWVYTDTKKLVTIQVGQLCPTIIENFLVYPKG